jgi:urease accessory protein
LPVQIAGGRLRVRADHVIAEMITGLGGDIVALEAPFDPETGAYHADQ